MHRIEQCHRDSRLAGPLQCRMPVVAIGIGHIHAADDDDANLALRHVAYALNGRLLGIDGTGREHTSA